MPSCQAVDGRGNLQTRCTSYRALEKSKTIVITSFKLEKQQRSSQDTYSKCIPAFCRLFHRQDPLFPYVSSNISARLFDTFLYVPAADVYKDTDSLYLDKYPTKCGPHALLLLLCVGRSLEGELPRQCLFSLLVRGIT